MASTSDDGIDEGHQQSLFRSGCTKNEQKFCWSVLEVYGMHALTAQEL